MLKIKKDDEVVVLTGRDQGKRGSVLRVRQPGGIVEQEAPIQSSNVAIWNDEAEKADRVGFRVEDGKKVRFFKSTNKVIED